MTSPVASLCFTCSSVRNRVRVTMLVFTEAVSDDADTSLPFPFVAIMCRRMRELGNRSKVRERSQSQRETRYGGDSGGLLQCESRRNGGVQA